MYVCIGLYVDNEQECIAMYINLSLLLGAGTYYFLMLLIFSIQFLFVIKIQTIKRINHIISDWKILLSKPSLLGASNQ